MPNKNTTLTFIGTGGAFNAVERNLSAVIEASDACILIDCGSTVFYDLKAYHPELLDKITHIVISHLHSDHINSLEAFLQYRYYVALRGKKIPVPTIVAPECILQGLRFAPGLLKSNDDFGRPLTMTLETYANVVDNVRVMFDGGDSSIAYHPVKHVQTTNFDDFPTYGFDIEIRKLHEGSTTVIDSRHHFYTADCREVPAKLIKSRIYDTIFHDVSLFEGPNGGQGDVHISLNRLRTEMPIHLRKTTWLMHYGENFADYEQERIDAGFAGWTAPGMKFDLWTGEVWRSGVRGVLKERP